MVEEFDLVKARDPALVIDHFDSGQNTIFNVVAVSRVRTRQRPHGADLQSLSGCGGHQKRHQHQPHHQHDKLFFPHLFSSLLI